MKKLISSLVAMLLLASSFISAPAQKAYALTQNSITRSQVEQRALNMINLTWTYDPSKNSNISAAYASAVTQPTQFANATTMQAIGIPYNWGGIDGTDSHSYQAPWTNFLDAVSKGAYAGNINARAGLGYIPGTAGLDCSGFVQAAFNIQDYKQSTTTLFNNYFTKIALSDIKHMDILDKLGSHVVIFDKWGTMNGINGAFTYESTPDQTFGGIQGVKRYFMTMTELNSGYVPGRYINIADDPTPVQPTVTTTPSAVTVAPVATTPPAVTVSPAVTTPTSNQTMSPVAKGYFAQVANVNSTANVRAAASVDSSIIETIPKGTIIYLNDSSNGWYQIKYNNQTGWIYGNLVASIPSGKYVTLNNVSYLNIRSAASGTSPIIGFLSIGQYAQVIDYSNNGSWYEISINGVQGWAYKQYLSYIY